MLNKLSRKKPTPAPQAKKNGGPGQAEGEKKRKKQVEGTHTSHPPSKKHKKYGSSQLVANQSISI